MLILVPEHIQKKPNNMNIFILRAFSERSFLYLWIGEVFTQIATNLFNFFLILVVYNLTQSNTAVSIAVLTFTLPAIFFGSIAGVLVDRWSKKKVLLVANFTRAIILVLFAFSLQNIVALYILAFMFTIMVQFFIPAESPMIPLLVKEKLLLAANALFGLAIFGSMLIAYVLSGPLIIWLGPFKTSLFLAGLFIIGAAFISLIRPHHHYKQEELRTGKLEILHDLKETFRFMSDTKEILRALLMLSLSQILVLTLATIAPGYAAQVLKIPVEQFPLIFVAPAAFGMVVGAVGLVNLFRNKPKEWMIRLGILVSGIVMLVLPYASHVAAGETVQTLNSLLPAKFEITAILLLVGLAFMLGAANALVFVPSNTILQEKTSETLRGKMYGFLNTSVGVFSLIPILLVGSLSDLIGVSNVIVGIGITLLFLWISLIITK